MNFLKKLKTKEPKYNYQLDDSHPYYDLYTKLYRIIYDRLEYRDECPMEELVEDGSLFGYEVQKVYIPMFFDSYLECDMIIDLEDIIKLDRYESGHVDYLHKFAFHLAEKVYEASTRTN